MSKEREALVDSALDRMAENARELGLDYEPPCKTGSQCTNKCQQCEQPAPVATPHKQREPVVWMYVNKSTHETKFQKHMRDFVDHSLWSEVPLYGEPLANHELQCVCGAVWLGDEMVHLPNKHPPASKPWVGLTEEERRGIREWQRIQEELGPVWAPMMLYLYEAVEAKLREKNA